MKRFSQAVVFSALLLLPIAAAVARDAIERTSAAADVAGEEAVETAHAQQPTGRAGEREISASTKRENALDSVVVLARQLYPELYSDR